MFFLNDTRRTDDYCLRFGQELSREGESRKSHEDPAYPDNKDERLIQLPEFAVHFFSSQLRPGHHGRQKYNPSERDSKHHQQTAKRRRCLCRMPLALCLGRPIPAAPRIRLSSHIHQGCCLTDDSVVRLLTVGGNPRINCSWSVHLLSPAANQIPQIQSVDVREARGLRRPARVFGGANDRNDNRIERAVVECRPPSHAFFSAAKRHVMPDSRSRSTTNLCGSQKRAGGEVASA